MPSQSFMSITIILFVALQSFHQNVVFRHSCFEYWTNGLAKAKSSLLSTRHSLPCFCALLTISSPRGCSFWTVPPTLPSLLTPPPASLLLLYCPPHVRSTVLLTSHRLSCQNPTGTSLLLKSSVLASPLLQPHPFSSLWCCPTVFPRLVFPLIHASLPLPPPITSPPHLHPALLTG